MPTTGKNPKPNLEVLELSRIISFVIATGPYMYCIGSETKGGQLTRSADRQGWGTIVGSSKDFWVGVGVKCSFQWWAF